MDSEIVWTPSEAQKKASAMWAFSKRAGFEGDYPALLDWSIREPEAFHALLWDALGIVGDRGEAAFRAGPTIKDAQFYPGARLNYAENLLQLRDATPAIIAHRETARGANLPGHALRRGFAHGPGPARRRRG